MRWWQRAAWATCAAWLPSSRALGTCPDTPSDFEQLVQAAELEGAVEEWARLEAAMSCLQTIPRRPDLARAYVVVAASVYERTQRFPSAAAYLCAAESVDATLVPHAALVPEADDHPMRRAWQARCPFGSDPLRTPVETWVDGRQLATVPGTPAIQPYLLQYQQEDGTWISQVVPQSGFPEVPPEVVKRRERWVTPTIGVLTVVGIGIGAWYSMSVNGRNDGVDGS